jgi:beta-lactamase regulating signal transducer with metallopeptidase domain
MITGWMLQFAAVSAFLTLAAVAAERVLRLWRKEGRAIWAIVMIASLALPLISIAQAAGLIPMFSRVSTIAPVGARTIPAFLPRVTIGSEPSRIDLAIGYCWVVTSVLLALRFSIASRSLARRRAAWRSAVVDGHQLLVSPNAGPAVIGFREPVVVIPEWVLDLEMPLRELVLRHECEHLEHNDPRLLLGAVVIATVAPWNLVLWFQLYRLRSAMELDCDLRVLRAHPNARRYGSLLLAVAQRADRGELLSAALTESNTLLARRIAAMRRPISSFRVTQSLLLATAAILAGVVACDLKSPNEPAIKSRVTAPSFIPPDQAYFEFQVEEPVTPAVGGAQPRYPDMLRKAEVSGEVLAQFIVGVDGLAEPQSFKVLKSDHDLFTAAVRSALPQMRFNAARVGGKAVRQLVQQPFLFTLTK